MRFKARVDGWFMMLLISPLIILILIPYLIEGYISVALWIVFLSTAAMVVWLIFGSVYILKEDHLLIQILFIRQRINYVDIESIKLTRNILSSMALSLDRIEIKTSTKSFFRKTTYISPKNRNHFYTLLVARCPKLHHP